MDTTEKTLPSEPTPGTDEHHTPVVPYTLLHINRAYNRKEITLEEWLRLTKEWAEQVIRQLGKAT